ncbi:MAG: DegV family protein [Candidatus Coproplasma sp.]
MKDYVILTDSCSDLGQDVREKYDIDYVQMNIVYNGKELPASLDWDLYTPVELYNIMRGGTRITTNQVPVQTFDTVFTKYLEEGKDIIYIGCSSKLSGSVNTGKVVADELAEKYPNNKIYVIDSLNSCLGEGLMTIDAAKMREKGKSCEEVAAYVEANKNKYQQFCAVEDLTYLKRAGRVKASAAFFGNLFGVKPILISNKLGENFALKKVKGRKNSLDEIFNMAKQAIVNPEEQTVALVHADCMADVEYLKNRIEKEMGVKEVYVNYIGPIIGASAGPGTIAIYCKCDEINV